MADDSDLKKKLKRDFEDGKIPTGAHFGDLIDAFALESELTADDGVFQRLDNLEHPDNGSFTSSVTIGKDAGKWDINVDAKGSLAFKPETDNPAAWVRMPARVGTLTRDVATDNLAQIEALGLDYSTMNGREFFLISPRDSAFAVEVVASVEPVPPDDGQGADKKGIFSKMLGALARPQAGPAMVRAVAISAGGDTPPRVEQQVTPLTTFRVALARNVIEFVLFVALVFFISDNVNTEIQQIEVHDDWFEKSFTLAIQDSVACPVMKALATVKLYKMPPGKCLPAGGVAAATAADSGAEETQASGDAKAKTGAENAPSATSSEAPSGGSSDGAKDAPAAFNPDPDWVEKLTGVKPETSGGTGAENGKSPNSSGGSSTVPSAEDADTDKQAISSVTYYKMAYAIFVATILAILAFFFLRSVSMWMAMRRGLTVQWVKAAKAPGGITLVMRRRGSLSTPTAKVRYHMTQLWG